MESEALQGALERAESAADAAAMAADEARLAADQAARVGGVTIIGYVNTAGRIAASSSALLARNILAFVDPMIDKEAKAFSPKRDDAIVAATLLTADGTIVHPQFAPKPEPTEGVS